jgi:integrase
MISRFQKLTPGPDTPLRLDVAAGGMTASGLRREASRGRLTIERIAGKDFTTLAAIASMREKCRAQLPHPDSTSESAAMALTSGSSSMLDGRSAQEHLRAIAAKLSCTDYVDWRSTQKDARAKNEYSKRVSVSTARRELVVLSAALRWCWKEGLLDRPIPVALPPQSEPRERHLTRTEAAQLLWGALGFDADGKRHPFRINRHLARFILFGLYTGTRHDAILRLQWMPNTSGGWIDLKAGVLYRRPRGAVESGKRRPPLPIPPRLLPHLQRWRKHTARYLIEWQGLPIASQERRAWRRARELARLSTDVTPHVLRHTAATWLLQRGVSVYDVAGVLGCSEQVIRRTYGHHAKDHLRAAVAAFSRRQ